MDGFPIETERLRIRQFTPDDWRAVHAYTSDAEVMTYILDWGGPQTEEQARQFVADTIGDEARAFGLILKDEGWLIGHMLFHPWFGLGTYEVG